MADGLNSKGNKRGMSENSLKNLKQDFTPTEREENGRKGAEKTNQIKREKIRRENSKDYAWEQYGIEFLRDVAENGTTKDKVELIKALFPNDKQQNEIIGNLAVEKIFITQEEKQATDNHIDDVINDGLTE